MSWKTFTDKQIKQITHVESKTIQPSQFSVTKFILSL